MKSRDPLFVIFVLAALLLLPVTGNAQGIHFYDPQQNLMCDSAAMVEDMMDDKPATANTAETYYKAGADVLIAYGRHLGIPKDVGPANGNYWLTKGGNYEPVIKATKNGGHYCWAPTQDILEAGEVRYNYAQVGQTKARAWARIHKYIAPLGRNYIEVTSKDNGIYHKF